MSKKKTIIIIIGLVVLVVGWYLFRPERLWINQTVNEGFPGAAGVQAADQRGPQIIYQGRFHKVAHDAMGTATVYQDAMGQRVLRFTDFRVSNGPDVHVYLIATQDALDSETVTKAGFHSLGPIKGNVGDQNYQLPSDLDLNKYRAVTVWCKRFGVNFATAPLAEPGMTSVSSASAALYAGNFHGVAHEGQGNATVYQLPDGRRTLRFTNFHVSNGPDVHVYLVAADDAKDNATVTKAGFLELGPIKGNVGDQNYDLPSGVDLDKYRSVTIWCKRFGVNFATAPLGARDENQRAAR